MNDRFTLKWLNPWTGHYFVTNYWYDGLKVSGTRTRMGFVRKCIAFGKHAGFVYCGYKSGSVSLWSGKK